MTDEIIIPNTYELRHMGIWYIKLKRYYGQQSTWFEVEGLADNIAHFAVKDYEQLYYDCEFMLLNQFRASVDDIHTFLDFLKANKELITNGIKEPRNL